MSLFLRFQENHLHQVRHLSIFHLQPFLGHWGITRPGQCIFLQYATTHSSQMVQLVLDISLILLHMSSCKALEAGRQQQQVLQAASMFPSPMCYSLGRNWKSAGRRNQSKPTKEKKAEKIDEILLCNKKR